MTAGVGWWPEVHAEATLVVPVGLSAGRSVRAAAAAGLVVAVGLSAVGAGRSVASADLVVPVGLSAAAAVRYQAAAALPVPVGLSASRTLRTPAAAGLVVPVGLSAAGAGHGLYTGVSYAVSGTYTGLNAPTYAVMNNGSATGADNQWGSTNSGTSFIEANLGSSKFVSRIVVGYDYLNNLPSGWGTSYTSGAQVQMWNGSQYVNVTTLPTYASSGSSNGLVSVPINQTTQYIRLVNQNTNYLVATEFQLWS